MIRQLFSGTIAVAAASAVALTPQTHTPVRVETEAVELTQQTIGGIPALTFAAGKYIEYRVSDRVNIPLGAAISFINLPPGLNYNPATTAVYGTPTTPGVYTVSAVAAIAGITAYRASTTVTITGVGVSAPAQAVTVPATAGTTQPKVDITEVASPVNSPQSPGQTAGAATAPRPLINPVIVDRLPVNNTVKSSLKAMLAQFNNSVARFAAMLPLSS